MPLPPPRWIALLTLACAACAPRASERDKQIDALGSIADRYRAPDASAATAPEAKAIAGWADYDDGRSAVSAGDLPRAITSLRRAVDANPECAEYWYNLGAAQANRAIELVNDSESEAVRMFGESVDSKRRSLELMNQGKFQFYAEAEQRQVRSDAANGLVGIDAVLADPQSLVAALKMYAAR